MISKLETGPLNYIQNFANLYLKLIENAEAVLVLVLRHTKAFVMNHRKEELVVQVNF